MFSGVEGVVGNLLARYRVRRTRTANGQKICLPPHLWQASSSMVIDEKKHPPPASAAGFGCWHHIWHGQPNFPRARRQNWGPHGRGTAIGTRWVPNKKAHCPLGDDSN